MGVNFVAPTILILLLFFTTVETAYLAFASSKLKSRRDVAFQKGYAASRCRRSSCRDARMFESSPWLVLKGSGSYDSCKLYRWNRPREETLLHAKSASQVGTGERLIIRDKLLELISSTPSNAPTSKELTQEILNVVRELELQCPTSDEDVLTELGGNWELLWTAQDTTTPEWKQGPLRSWINPLENQSYSNNPGGSGSSFGRANPILPREIQDQLESMGIIRPSGEKSSGPSTSVRSSQAIDLKKRRVRNLVTFQAPNLLGGFFPSKRNAREDSSGVRGSLMVDVKFRPNDTDPRRVDVKFESCRLRLQETPLDLTFPLGPIGPTGWLRTVYIDDTLRITRGHKGSVFVLSRTAQRKAVD